MFCDSLCYTGREDARRVETTAGGKREAILCVSKSLQSRLESLAVFIGKDALGKEFVSLYKGGVLYC